MPTILPATPAAHFAVGLIIGVGVGLVSSVLGVAGGELLIPATGADLRGGH